MDFEREYFKGKNATITGGAGGIGLAIAVELLNSDAGKIVLADINEERMADTLKDIEAEYGPDRVRGIICDVTKEEQVQSLIAESAEFFGGTFDLLFNNAGAGFLSWFEGTDNDAWKAAFDLNFYSAVYGMRAVLPLMKEQGGGQIINTISGIAFSPMAAQSRYAATKAALNALTIALRTEYWDDNIKISSATPGTTATNIFTVDGGAIPEGAQTPEQSATRILNGVVNNDRVIYGDDKDKEGGRYCFDPDSSELVDEFLLDIARQRYAGKLAL